MKEVTVEARMLTGDASNDTSIAKVLLTLLMDITDKDQTRSLSIVTHLTAIMMGNIRVEYFDEELEKHVAYLREAAPKVRADLLKYAAERGLKVEDTRQ